MISKSSPSRCLMLHLFTTRSDLEQLHPKTFIVYFLWLDKHDRPVVCPVVRPGLPKCLMERKFWFYFNCKYDKHKFHVIKVENIVNKIATIIILEKIIANSFDIVEIPNLSTIRKFNNADWNMSALWCNVYANKKIEKFKDLQSEDFVIYKQFA